MAFVTRDEARLYWRADGDEGKPSLLLLNSLGTDHAILRLDEDVGLGAQIVDHGHRHAHAQIDEHAIANVLSGAPRNLQAVERLHGQVPTATTRST